MYFVRKCGASKSSTYVFNLTVIDIIRCSYYFHHICISLPQLMILSLNLAPLCDDVSAPSGGSKSESNEHMTVGSTVTFTCNSDHLLLGFDKITCGADKQWSASLPTCGKKEPAPPPILGPSYPYPMHDAARLSSAPVYGYRFGFTRV